MDRVIGLQRSVRRLLLGGMMMVVASVAISQTPLAPDEVERVLSLGPWPLAASVDPGNRVSGQAAAIELGRQLFFDGRLSRIGYIGCVTCHQPDRAWSDGKARAHGLADVDRNTPMLTDLRLKRWYGWGGASDSLWMASLRPILDDRELDSTPAHVRHLYVRDPDLACWYRRVFGRAADDASDDDLTVLVNSGKALAAFEETLLSGRTAFDEYRDALERGDIAAAEQYPAAAVRGLKIFVGRGNCVRCHSGPNFSDGEFHATGVDDFTARGRPDGGRFDDIKSLTTDRFSLLSKFNDDSTRANAAPTRSAERAPGNWREFRTPSLRNVAVTAPYMHNGSLETLHDVLRHHSELDEEPLHAGGEELRRAVRPSEAEMEDMIAFLETLTDRFGADRPRPAAPKECIAATP